MSVVNPERQAPQDFSPKADRFEYPEGECPSVIDTLSRLACRIVESELPDYDRDRYREIEESYLIERITLMSESTALFRQGKYIECQIILRRVADMVQQSFDRSSLPFIEHTLSYLNSVDTAHVDYGIADAIRRSHHTRQQALVDHTASDPIQKAA